MKTLFESQMDFFAWGEERPDVVDWYPDEIVLYNESTGIGAFKLYHIKLDDGREDEIMLAFIKSTDDNQRTIMVNVKYYTKNVTLGNFYFYVTSVMTKHWKDRSEYTLNIFWDELVWNHHLGLPKELVEDIIKTADEQVTEHERDLYEYYI